MASDSPKTPKPSYAAALNADSPIPFAIADLPSPFLEEGLISIRISEEPFLRGLERCKSNLIGRVNSQIKTPDLVQQLKHLWSGLEQWTVAPLGRGFFMLQFKTLSDMQRVWSSGTVRLNSGMLRLIKWSPEFSPSTYKNTFAQVWVRFWDLGFAYWDQQTLFEIASGLGTPLKLDTRTKNRTIGLFARVLVDIDLSQSLHDKIRITRANGEVVVVGVEYESPPDICSRCGIVGHIAANCHAAPSESPEDAGVPTERGRSVARSTQKRRKKNKSRSQRRSKLDPTSGLAPTRNITSTVRAEAVTNTVEEAPLIPENTIVSSDSVPPGFQRLVPEIEAQDSSSTSTPVVSAVAPPIVIADCNQTSEDCPLEESTEVLEEGEFTPVLSKKSKKLLKQNDKTKKKVVSRKPSGRALLNKGANLKCF
ncbi:uncharacterized protein LOC133732294 [Rosa rugosa]|uniref:uncharacterized protein LOC133732294 n=1 Tax=Rosa rugosa TaxID=74645 RepID=UPI002B404119|nr:uncharacterized protein LOC133732294 [Rosa rugosa]